MRSRSFQGLAIRTMWPTLAADRSAESLRRAEEVAGQAKSIRILNEKLDRALWEIETLAEHLRNTAS